MKPCVWKKAALALVMSMLSVHTVQATLPGDVTNDNEVDLRDAIVALQVVSNKQGNSVYVTGDVNGDAEIGTEEAIYALQCVAGRQPGEGEVDVEDGRWAQATSEAPWSGRYGHACVVHDDAMYVIGGQTMTGASNDVWSSEDGFTWSLVTEAAGWPPRALHACVSFKGQIWLIGGNRDIGGPSPYLWRSTDGATWEQVNGAMPYGKRYGHCAVVFDGKMWIIGGAVESTSGNVWYSEDGENWFQAQDNLDLDYKDLEFNACVVNDNKIWLMGNQLSNGIWYSSDGSNWEKVAASAPWYEEDFPAAAAYHGALFFINSSNSSNDITEIFYSGDGTKWWKQRTPAWPFRSGMGLLFFDDRLWVLGGSGWSGSSFYPCNEVWYYEGLLECEPAIPNQAPSVTLNVDPPIGPAPHQVLLKADAKDRNCDSLTYLWDVGEGPKPGGKDLFLTLAQNGTYSVSVTVSDGEFEKTDTAVITVMDLPKETVGVDGTGGTVVLGKCELTVHPGIAPETVNFAVIEFPSMGPWAVGHIDPEAYKPFGPTYRVDTPLHSNTPFTARLAYDPTDLPPGFSGEHLGALIRVVGNSDPDPGSSEIPELVVDYVVLPVVPSGEVNKVDLDMFTGGMVQLVAMKAPLDVVEASSVGTAAAEVLGENNTAGFGGLGYSLIYIDDPTRIDRETYSYTVHEVIGDAYDKLVTSMGFPGPVGLLQIVVKKLPNVGLAFRNPFIIELASRLPVEAIRRTLPHEFFHIIQGHCTNTESYVRYFVEDAWFVEGTAEWASDEVYDGLSPGYNCPKETRFARQLNEPVKDGHNEYETVAFWKWVETKHPGTIKQALLNQQLATMPWVTGPLAPTGVLIELSGLYKRQWSFLLALPDPDFLEFCGSSLYWKDYDTDEDETGDLWHPDKLGPPRTLPGSLGNKDSFVTLDEGDDESHPVEVTYQLRQALTASVRVVSPLDQDTDPSIPNYGTLHIKWKQPSGAQPYDALVIVKHGSRDLLTQRVRDLSAAHTETAVPFFQAPDYQAIIILVDPRWDVEPSTLPPTQESFEVWVTGCGPLPGNDTIPLTLDDLEDACRTTSPGNTILLGEGQYVLRRQSWSLSGYPDQWGGLMLNGLTLAGEGPDRTVLYVPNDSAAAILTHGDAEIRNLSIYVSGPFSVISSGTGLKLCAVEIEYSHWQPGVSISHIPFEGGFSNVQISGSALIGLSFKGSGLYLETCGSASESQILCNIENTVISGWQTGVEWYTYDNCGPIAVSAECNYIGGNVFGNVVESMCQGGPCYNVEHCPSLDTEGHDLEEVRR